jgi:hypothetical protein
VRPAKAASVPQPVALDDEDVHECVRDRDEEDEEEEEEEEEESDDEAAAVDDAAEDATAVDDAVEVVLLESESLSLSSEELVLPAPAPAPVPAPAPPLGPPPGAFLLNIMPLSSQYFTGLFPEYAKTLSPPEVPTGSGLSHRHSQGR